MSYRYPNHRIQEIVKARKAVSEGHELCIKRENKGGNFDVPLDLIDGAFCDLRFLGRAGRLDDVTSYDTSLLLDQRRVRGIGFCEVGRKSFRAKKRIPAGWHQNVCDPNVPTDDPNWNRHLPLSDFDPTDFVDFVRRASELWHIDGVSEPTLL